MSAVVRVRYVDGEGRERAVARGVPVAEQWAILPVGVPGRLVGVQMPRR
jgi:hypothetical protein